jgi:hypothetical protein
MGLDMYLYEKEVHEVAYWRKANAIHGWIINRTNAVDDCTPINLYKQDIVDLRNTCQEVLIDPSKAEELLPPTPGFFFGSTEVDDWYLENVKDTVEKLTTIIDQSVDDAIFEYQASW